MDAAHTFLDLAKTRQWEEVRRVLAGKPELINAQPCGRFSALHQASQANNAAAVSFLLEARADVHAKTSAGQIAADLATEPAVKALLHSRHAAISARQDLEHEFLNLAKARKWKELAALLAEVPDLARAQPGGRWSALHQAASAGHLDSIRLLLASRADAAARNSDGKTPIEVATAAARPLLLEVIEVDSSLEREGQAKKAKTDPGALPQPTFSRLEGPFELPAPKSEPRRGVYSFQPSTGSLRVDGEEVAIFRAEAVSTMPFPKLIAERPTKSSLASCVTIVSGEIIEEIQKASNAGAVFVLPSQLNGAEYPMHNYIVDQIYKYKYDKTGGPRGQLAVHPAVGQFVLDNAACDKRTLGLDATDAALAAAKASPTWPSGYNLHVKNGYMAVPHCPASSQEAVLANLRSSLHKMRCLSAWGVPAAGLRPDLQDFSAAAHKVHMVYASAIPVKAYLNAGNMDVAFQEEISRLVILSQYFGALRLAAAAATPPAKQRVVLMPLGGGVFNNRAEVIVGALVTALEVLAAQGVDVSRLDVRLLAFRGSAGEQERMSKLFRSFSPEAPAAPAALAAPVVSVAPPAAVTTAAPAPPIPPAARVELSEPRSSTGEARAARAPAERAEPSSEPSRREEPPAPKETKEASEAKAGGPKPAPSKPKRSVLDMLLGSDSQ